MTTNTLLALVDGSTYSESVCHHASWIAARNGWKVEIYHVMGRREAADTGDLSGAIRLGARTELLEQLSELDAARSRLAQEHGRAILDDAKAIVEGSGDIVVETRLRRGDLIETITAKEESGEMIVIGKRGEAAGHASNHLGSNLERIVRASHKPVFIANRAFRPIGRVLVAYDGGASSRKAVDYIAQSPLFEGLAVSLVFAGRETPEIRRSLDDATAAISAAGREAQNLVRQGEPEKVLADLTDGGNVDLLVMGAYGHSRIRSLIIGSTTTENIRACKVPVLVMQ